MLVAAITTLGVCLLADAEFFLGDDCTITVDVFANQVIEQTTTLTNKHLQCTLRSIIFLVDLKVFGQVGNTVGE